MGKWDTKQPCASCPYRKDAELELWAKEEFIKLQANDNGHLDPDPGAAIYGCHKFRFRPISKREVCAGWFLDQVRRGFPNIALRVSLSLEGEKAKAIVDELNDGGNELYESIEEMCEANNV